MYILIISYLSEAVSTPYHDSCSPHLSSLFRLRFSTLKTRLSSHKKKHYLLHPLHESPITLFTTLSLTLDVNPLPPPSRGGQGHVDAQSSTGRSFASPHGPPCGTCIRSKKMGEGERGRTDSVSVAVTTQSGEMALKEADQSRPVQIGNGRDELCSRDLHVGWMLFFAFQHALATGSTEWKFGRNVENDYTPSPPALKQLQRNTCGYITWSSSLTQFQIDFWDG